ncbi:MAG TPA: hypothetical protein IGS52_11460 [Oscillatoriaceae cyanobacterium M33_DOE_052]|uniref:Uncharacterized protein n=1 Tax=Planktothricoides sp. SpSt-374 TaxID=2282167 RepID=A0A7C3VK95_9CYAN|nr:hypothetical protein [Oscillatoriaceae cyanobacterium M33_DOE_052]
MHIEFLVEEMSAQVALQNILAKIFFGYHITFDIHPYQGKLDLINKLCPLSFVICPLSFVGETGSRLR